MDGLRSILVGSDLAVLQCFQERTGYVIAASSRRNHEYYVGLAVFDDAGNQYKGDVISFVCSHGV